MACMARIHFLCLQLNPNSSFAGIDQKGKLRYLLLWNDLQASYGTLSWVAGRVESRVKETEPRKAAWKKREEGNQMGCATESWATRKAERKMGRLALAGPREENRREEILGQLEAFSPNRFGSFVSSFQNLFINCKPFQIHIKFEIRAILITI
jgi:hypothetical protein